MTIKNIAWNGTAITKPGLYSKIPLDTYHSAKICDGPSVSSSGLRRAFNQSPAHFYCEWPGNPNCTEPEDKAHFILGRALHHLMLGELFFAKLFAVRPVELPHYKTGELRAWHGNNIECKVWLAATAKSGRAVLSASDVESIKGMAGTLSAHPIIKAGALNGLIERSIFWKDKDTGLWLKSRPDSIPESDVDFVDLKTTTSVRWDKLQRTVAEMGYCQQGALVCEAARRILGIERPTFTLVFVEKTPPYSPRVVTLKDEDLQRGAMANRAAIDAIARCLKSGHWPGPGGEREDAEHIDLPDYVRKQIDDRIEFGIA